MKAIGKFLRDNGLYTIDRRTTRSTPTRRCASPRTSSPRASRSSIAPSTSPTRRSRASRRRPPRPSRGGSRGSGRRRSRGARPSRGGVADRRPRSSRSVAGRLGGRQVRSAATRGGSPAPSRATQIVYEPAVPVADRQRPEAAPRLGHRGGARRAGPAAAAADARRVPRRRGALHLVARPSLGFAPRRASSGSALADDLRPLPARRARVRAVRRRQPDDPDRRPRAAHRRSRSGTACSAS